MAAFICLLALYLIHISNIESHPLHPHHLVIPPKGITFQIQIKPELDTHGKHPGQMKMEVLVKEVGPKNAPRPPPKPPVPTHDEPTIENRFGVRAGTCPVGYVKRGGFCFPDTDY